ncbi:MAG: SH3 domain-containing protein [Deltaproteobacteria bacterium]|nr:SH3 domain-containing protein [Deltaproteobacteria bacterium]
MSRRSLSGIFLLLAWAGLGLGVLEAGAGVGGAGLAEIRVGRANVRKAPDRNSPKLFSLNRKTRVTVLEERDKWVLIKADKDELRGWIFKSLVNFIKPALVEPEIEFFGNDLAPEQELFFSSWLNWLRRQLAAPEKRQLELVVSRLAAPALVKPEKSRSSGFQDEWLLVLRLPFSREFYLAQKGSDLGPGTIDLLPYLGYLEVMLKGRDLLRMEMQRQPQVWTNDGVKTSNFVRVVIFLQAENGDRVGLSGSKKSGFPVFDPYLIMEIHGFSRFVIASTLPDQVAEFNQFALPSAQLPNGNRAAAALAYDFFGCPD